MNIKKGDVLKAKNGYGECTVLGIVDGLYFMSKRKEKNGTEFLTLEGLKETFELPEEKWVPKYDTRYWSIEITGAGRACVMEHGWVDDEIDNREISISNVFKTKEAAEAKLSEILNILNK